MYYCTICHSHLIIVYNTKLNVSPSSTMTDNDTCLLSLIFDLYAGNKAYPGQINLNFYIRQQGLSFRTHLGLQFMMIKPALYTTL